MDFDTELGSKATIRRFGGIRIGVGIRLCIRIQTGIRRFLELSITECELFWSNNINFQSFFAQPSKDPQMHLMLILPSIVFLRSTIMPKPHLYKYTQVLIGHNP